MSGRYSERRECGCRITLVEDFGELVAQGVVVHPGQVYEMRQDTYTTSKGSVMNRTVVIMSYRFAHAESGTFIDTTVVGEGADVGDKSANKALTGAYKYALRQTLLIETGDDPDNFQSEQRSNGDAVTEVRMSTAKPLAIPSAVKPAPKLDGKVEDPRAWLKEKVQNDTVNFGFVADAAVMTGHYNDREHVRNALSGYEIAPGTKLDNPDFRIKVTAAGGFKVFDWLMSRKEVDDVA